ncbi:hypothetical protein Pan153_35620 [Gimesia panareensis]|uniref:Glycosyltransferase RgtA/B/C/D-like domain-containing protein n=1 Tax=Gimesia panareensis TaxID=2527978 RepID=A0A518FRC6_9PLAN|nr:hypothetical protein Pan153_35620 [Gimesia panareensis]
MATALKNQNESGNENSSEEHEEDAVLVDRFPEAVRVSRFTFFSVCVLSLAFVLFSSIPLWHTDIWGHLAYGRLIWEMGSIPEFAPLMPLSSGMSFIDTAWLSQISAFKMYEIAGVAGIKFLYAAAITACMALLLYRVQQRTGSFIWSMVCISAFLLCDWKQLGIVRPQLAGLLCFVTLFFLLTARNWRKANWVLIPLLFVFWANLHGSFPVGLGLIGCFLVGRAIDVSWKMRNWKAMLGDSKTRRYLILLELSAIAVLFNPYGLQLYSEVFSFSSNPNLADLIEWNPLTLRMYQGKAAGLITLLLVIASRFTPRRISTAEVLLLVGLGISALWSSRMIIWWAPVAAYYLAIHGAAICRWKLKRLADPGAEKVFCAGKWTIVSVGVIWICFAVTPMGSVMLHGKEVDFERSVSESTPIGAVKYLKEKQIQGQVFNSMELGDYLLWAGPENLDIFANSHAHLLPREVWNHYLRISNLAGDAEELLDRYGINTIVLDLPRREGLMKRLVKDGVWRVGYKDGRSVVLLRNKPIQ